MGGRCTPHRTHTYTQHAVSSKTGTNQFNWFLQWLICDIVRHKCSRSIIVIQLLVGEHRGADGSADEFLIAVKSGEGKGARDGAKFLQSLIYSIKCIYCSHLYATFIERRKKQSLPVPVKFSELSSEVVRIAQCDLLFLAVAAI